MVKRHRWDVEGDPPGHWDFWHRIEFAEDLAQKCPRWLADLVAFHLPMWALYWLLERAAEAWEREYEREAHGNDSV